MAKHNKLVAYFKLISTIMIMVVSAAIKAFLGLFWLLHQNKETLSKCVTQIPVKGQSNSKKLI